MSDHPDSDLSPFTPVPTRARRDGWTPAKQRAFLEALARTGQVGLAARAVGMSHQSAWRLRGRAQAESFAAAWDSVLDEARARALDLAIERGIAGGMVPRYYRGRFVRMEHRADNGALIAALRHLRTHPPGR
jgi:hypothetical protein